MAWGVDAPPELSEAEGKYSGAVTKLLEKADNDAEARRKLAQLNQSFVNHLRELLPKVQARSPEQARLIAQRLSVMQSKLDASLQLGVLDGRVATDGAQGQTPPRKLGPQPEGSLDSREAGDKVKIGDRFEIKGKTKNVPDGHVVQVFGIPKWGGVFPKEDRKDPNRRFTLMASATESWLGPVQFVVLSMPEDLMKEIDAWILLRRRWEDAGFPAETKPPFRGVASTNIYLDQLLALGALKLAELKVEYVR